MTRSCPSSSARRSPYASRTPVSSRSGTRGTTTSGSTRSRQASISTSSPAESPALSSSCADGPSGSRRTGERATPLSTELRPTWAAEASPRRAGPYLHHMKALVYRGPRKVEVTNVPDARIERPTDALVRITSTNICGSDLHMYEGRTSVEKGKVLGHENLGEVVEVGSAVDRVKVGDQVCLPFNIACGFCENCERGFTGFCLTVNPGMAGGAYGYADMGPYQG